MTRREDYLGCRVSEISRGYSTGNRPTEGAWLSRSEGRPEHKSNHDTTPTFEESVADIFRAAREILLSKHHDYGPTNISNAPGGALNGLRVRIHDKTARINNLIDSGKSAQHESLRDSFLDLMNYAAIALLVIDGDWPGVEPSESGPDCG